MLFVAEDLLYYVFHRCNHRVRWLWAAHVVHHARNDRNFAWVQAIWDRLYGSHVNEGPHDAPVYDNVEALSTYNPLKAAFHEWASMGADVLRVKGSRNRLSASFAPPSWTATYHAQLAEAGAATGEPREESEHVSAQACTTTSTATSSDNAAAFEPSSRPGGFCKQSPRRRRGGRRLHHMARRPHTRR